MHCNLTILVPQESSDSQRTLFLRTLCESISKLIKSLELQEAEEQVYFLQQEVINLTNGH